MAYYTRVVAWVNFSISKSIWFSYTRVAANSDAGAVEIRPTAPTDHLVLPVVLC